MSSSGEMATAVKPSMTEAVEKALTKGDLSALSSADRMEYLRTVCESLGLNPLTRPFDFLTDKKGKVTLYARRECAEQLGRIHGVTIEIVARDVVDGLAIVQARATMPAGRSGKRANEDVGAVSVEGLKGEDKANAIMKAITKARRRAVLGLCGLGLLDESEVETIEGARVESRPAPAPAPAPRPAPALPAPTQPAPAAPAEDSPDVVLADIIALKSECGLQGEEWSDFLRPWQSRKPSAMPPGERLAVREALRQRQAITGDGLPNVPPPQRNGRTPEPASFPGS